MELFKDSGFFQIIHSMRHPLLQSNPATKIGLIIKMDLILMLKIFLSNFFILITRSLDYLTKLNKNFFCSSIRKICIKIQIIILLMIFKSNLRLLKMKIYLIQHLPWKTMVGR